MKVIKWKEIMIGGLLPGGTAQEYRTGDWRDKRPVFNKDECINCLLCIEQCPDNAVKFEVVDGKPVMTGFDYFFCKGCGLCHYVCPKKDKAIIMKPETEFINE